MTVGLRQGENKWKVYLLVYSLCDEFRSLPPSSTRKPFSKRQVHWLYDELDVSEGRKGRFVHRVLLSDGRIMVVPFTNVSIQTMTMHAASLAGMALKSA